MKLVKGKLPSVEECISYVESLGYRLCWKRRDGKLWYHFEIINPNTRPSHNWEMTWNLNEMRHAFVNGC